MKPAAPPWRRQCTMHNNTSYEQNNAIWMGRMGGGGGGQGKEALGHRIAHIWAGQVQAAHSKLMIF